MGTLRKIICWVIMGWMAVSCSKPEDVYDGTSWYGEYPAKTQNGTTGEWEDQTAVIALDFREDATVGAITHGYVGLLGMNQILFDVQWTSRNAFRLEKSEGGQTLAYYAGKIRGETLSLQALNCDGVAATYELKKTH